MKWEMNEDDVRGAIICQCIANKWPEPAPWQIKIRERYSGSYSEELVVIDFSAKKPTEEAA